MHCSPPVRSTWVKVTQSQQTLSIDASRETIWSGGSLPHHSQPLHPNSIPAMLCGIGWKRGGNAMRTFRDHQTLPWKSFSFKCCLRMMSSLVSTVEVLRHNLIYPFLSPEKRKTYIIGFWPLIPRTFRKISGPDFSQFPKERLLEAPYCNACGPRAILGGLGFQWVLQLCELSQVGGYSILFEGLLLLDSCKASPLTIWMT